MNTSKVFGSGLTRREFLGTGLAAGSAMLLPGRWLFAETIPRSQPAPDVWVFHGRDKTQLMKACLKVIDENGGLGNDVNKLTLKVNAAWWRTPEQGANTHPALVDAFFKGCKDRGVKELVMPEHPCDTGEKAFAKSGLLQVAKENSARMVDLAGKENLFTEVAIPRGKKLKTAAVGKDFLQTDALVNMPVAKHHGGATLTIASKNWMGSVWDRGYWHQNNLHQCIADFGSFIQPKWTIVDATRIMLDQGPKGPAKRMKIPDLLILSADPIAADAIAATLFPDVGPQNVPHLRLADEMKLGVADPANITVHKIEVS